MKKGNWIFGVTIFAALVLLLYFSPNVTSMVFVGIMAVLMLAGSYLGIMQVHGYALAFCRGSYRLTHLGRVSTDDNWLFVRQEDAFFQHDALDKLFRRYQARVDEQRKAKILQDDLEDVLNEDVMELKTRRSIVNFIPAALTGIGILGTFYGLVTGLGGIRFSSAEVVVASISALVSEIDTAFYTSIAGVVLSILMELMVKLEWNYMLEKMREFLQSFQQSVIPTRDEQEQLQRQKLYAALMKEQA